MLRKAGTALCQVGVVVTYKQEEKTAVRLRVGGASGEAAVHGRHPLRRGVWWCVGPVLRAADVMRRACVGLPIPRGREKRGYGIESGSKSEVYRGGAHIASGGGGGVRTALPWLDVILL